MIGVLSAPALLAAELGRLEPVQRGHAYVHQDYRERLAARAPAARRDRTPPRRSCGQAASSIARSAMRLIGLSSTTRIAGAESHQGLRQSAGPSRTALRRADSSPSVGRVLRPPCGRGGRKPLAEDAEQLCVSTGLARYPEAPASMQRWRSPSSTFAVNAMSGISLPGGQLAHRAHRRVAVHSRHHDVDEHEVDVGALLQERRCPAGHSPPRPPRHRRV